MVFGTLRNSMIFTARTLLRTSPQVQQPAPTTEAATLNRATISHRQSYRVPAHIREIKVVSGAALALVNGEKQFVRKGHYLCFVAGRDEVVISPAYNRTVVIEMFA